MCTGGALCRLASDVTSGRPHFPVYRCLQSSEGEPQEPTSTHPKVAPQQNLDQLGSIGSKTGVAAPGEGRRELGNKMADAQDSRGPHRKQEQYDDLLKRLIQIIAKVQYLKARAASNVSRVTPENDVMPDVNDSGHGDAMATSGASQTDAATTEAPPVEQGESELLGNQRQCGQLTDLFKTLTEAGNQQTREHVIYTIITCLLQHGGQVQNGSQIGQHGGQRERFSSQTPSGAEHHNRPTGGAGGRDPDVERVADDTQTGQEKAGSERRNDKKADGLIKTEDELETQLLELLEAKAQEKNTHSHKNDGF